MDTRLHGRIAIITGASSGLGKATAVKFANAGARIVCADLKSSGVEDEITNQHGKDSATFIACNVAEESQIQNLVTEAVKWGGRLDIICNYAGIAVETAPKYEMKAHCHSFDTDDFDRTMTVNCRGTWLCCKYALKQMLEQEPREPNARGERTRGWIVNAAVVGSANAPAYVASKHAVVGMTKQMAIDYAKDRIHVNAICPGFIRTPMIDAHITTPESEAVLAGLHPWNALGRPKDIADAAMFLVSDEAAWITGHSLVVDGAYTIQ